MPREYSPFTPGIPVPIDFFVGRANEVKALIEKATSACSGRIERTFVYGERGIGKSSLCRFARVIVEKNLNMLGIHVFLGGATTLEEMVKRTFDKLVKDNVGKPWYEKIKGFLGEHVREVGLFGINVEFTAEQKELSHLVSNFSMSLRNLIQQFKGEKKGFMIILDDLNGLSKSAEFANWLKSFIDDIATSDNPLPLLLVLVGLPERRTQIFQIQPSLARAFDPIEIKKLSREETSTFYTHAFQGIGVSVEQVALDAMYQYSGGYPVLAHEIGDAVSKVDVDNQIDGKDALIGIFNAATVIGQKYIEPQVYDTIRSQKYHSILKKLARDHLGGPFQKEDVVKRLTPEEVKVFNNFLQKMKKLGVLIEDRESRGAYQFISDLHSLFIGLSSF
jgi:hypothetical protein